MKKKKTEGLKITTVNLSAKQHKFFKELQKMGLIASTSEAVRFCVNFTMPFYKKILDFLDDPHVDDIVNKIKNLRDSMIINDFQKNRPKWVNIPPKPSKNIFWEKRFVNGKWINVPREAEAEKLKELVRETLNNKDKKKPTVGVKKNLYNNDIVNSERNKYVY